MIDIHHSLNIVKYAKFRDDRSLTSANYQPD